MKRRPITSVVLMVLLFSFTVGCSDQPTTKGKTKEVTFSPVPNKDAAQGKLKQE